MKRTPRNYHTPPEVDDLGLLPVDLLLFHWGDPHVTDGTGCFCLPAEEDGLIIHRRLPWEYPQRREGNA